MGAKKWLKKRYCDEESGDWFRYDIFKAMEEYHQSRLKEIMPTKNKQLLRKFKKTEYRIWLLEHPRLFKDNEQAEYFPVLLHTVEPDGDESVTITIRFEKGIEHEKVNGDHYWKRVYMADQDGKSIFVDENNCSKFIKI